MKIIKPSWVGHDGATGAAIFSVDIHPDGSRVATAGQGGTAGCIIVWNMSPLRSKNAEQDENVPKVLCEMESNGCVNCVRWSHDGRSLASCGDDKLVSIWQWAKGQGPSYVFGSGGSKINREHWKCIQHLRGHSGDVIDVAWNRDDSYIASCSVDNSVIVWNALKFPEVIRTIKGHKGMVKGISWDPIGKYMASQSDDRTLSIWSVHSGWSLVATVTEPFTECCGTTHVLRCSWSPDGSVLLSAHAMNNAGPVAKVIERGTWAHNLDFVGHRKAITCTRFNPRLLRGVGGDQTATMSCCAVGSRDRSVSLWRTDRQRPLAVVHDLFTNTVMDLSWGARGRYTTLIACSIDGTVALLEFNESELGCGLSRSETDAELSRLYGKSFALSGRQEALLENPELVGTAGRVAPTTPTTVAPVTPRRDFRPPTTRQIESRTPTGRRRITPICIAALEGDIGAVPEPFAVATAEPPVAMETDASCPSDSQLSRGARDALNSRMVAPPSGPERQARAPPSGGIEAPTSVETVTKGPDDLAVPLVTVKQNDVPIPTNKQNHVIPVATSKHSDSAPLATRKLTIQETLKPEELRLDLGSVSSVVKQPLLAVPSPSSLSVTVATGSSPLLVEALSREGASLGAPLLRCSSRERRLWEFLLAQPVVSLAASSRFVVAGCADATLHAWTADGRLLGLPVALSAPVVRATVTDSGLAVVTADCRLWGWTLPGLEVGLRDVPMGHLLRDATTLKQLLLSDELDATVVASDGKVYRYSRTAGSWLLVADPADPLDCLLGRDVTRLTTGSNPLLNVTSGIQRVGYVSRLQVAMQRALQHPATPGLYRELLLRYARCLVDSGSEFRLRAVCEDLLGPVVSLSPSRSAWVASLPGGLSKRSLLAEVLGVIATNVDLQRVYSEYKIQLDSLSESS